MLLLLLDFYKAQQLKWLSQNKNKHLHIILALSGPENSVHEIAAKAMSNKDIETELIAMPFLSHSLIVQHMVDRLAKNDVIVEEDFIDSYLENYASANKETGPPKISSFLFLNLVCEQIKNGISEAFQLATSMKQAVGSVLYRAENAIGELVVRRAVGYIASARVGLTRLELQDLLTQDNQVAVYLRNKLKLPIFLTPPFLISKLIDIYLEPLLCQRRTDGWPVFVLKHWDARNIAYERYVLTRDSPVIFGRALSDYFLSNWSNQPRYVEELRKYERIFINSQQISFVPEETWDLKYATERGNLRRVDELPSAVILAGQKSVSIDAMKGDCFINYEYLLAAADTRGLPFIIDIFLWVLEIRKEPDEELNLVLESLKMSRLVLQKDITQLATQLCARLVGPVSKDIPVAPGDPPRLLNIRNMLRHIGSNHEKAALIPSGSALLPPAGKSLFVEINGGHRLPMTAMAISDDSSLLLTAALDDKMILWNLKIGGRIIRLFHNVGALVKRLLLARNNEIAVVVEKSRCSLWSTESGNMVKVIVDDYIDNLAVTLLREGNFLATCLNNCSTVSLWDLHGQDFELSSQADLSEWMEESLTSMTARLLMPINTSPDSLLLVACQRANFAIIWNFDTKKLSQRLKIAHSAGSIKAIGRSEELFVVTYMAYEESNRNVISVFDLFLASEKFQ